MYQESMSNITKSKVYKYIAPAVLLTSFIACYYSTFGWLHYKYSYVDSYYSHGYMIPFISAYLIYSMRDKLKDISCSGNNLGLSIILFSLVCHIFAVMSDINFISGYCILLYLIGSVLFLYGSKMFRHLLVPILFLIFMFPIPDTFINYFGLPTKSIATTIGLSIIRLLDIPFLREGFAIHLADTTLVVGTPCNGMKSLISFFALGVLAIYFTGIGRTGSIIFIILIYPLSVIINGMRIAILVYIAEKYGIEKASPDSIFHDLSGLVVFIIGFVILVFILYLFKKKNPADNS